MAPTSIRAPAFREKLYAKEDAKKSEGVNLRAPARTDKKQIW